MKRALVNEVFTNPVYLTACGFGAGLVPKAPGTVGTLVAIPIVVAISWLATSVQWVVLAAMFIVVCWVCWLRNQYHGNTESEDLIPNDDTGVVVPE